MELYLQEVLPEESFVDVPELTTDDIETILQELFTQTKRTLQPGQWEVLTSACQQCPLPLYAKIAFDEASSWKSHVSVNENALGDTVTTLISTLFDKVEKYHGKVLVSHALGYITAAKAGLRWAATFDPPTWHNYLKRASYKESNFPLWYSLGEIEDVLSIDDVALGDIYQYHMPPLRRLPPLLWVRIQSDLKDYLVSTGSGGVQVIRWYHRQFHTVAAQRYLAEEENR